MSEITLNQLENLENAYLKIIETLQNVEFMEKFHKLLISKGYEKPAELVFMRLRSVRRGL